MLQLRDYRLSGLWPLRFYPLSPSPLSGAHKKLKNFTIFQFKKQGSNLLEISIQMTHSYYVRQREGLRSEKVFVLCKCAI